MNSMEKQDEVKTFGKSDLEDGFSVEELEGVRYAPPWHRKLLSLGVEGRGIQPVPLDKRTDTWYSKIFFIWGSANFNILSFSAGTLGPVAYGLGLRDSCLVILFFNLLCCFFPAYLTTWGPKLGLRQMCQARYSFGYFGVIIPCILNLIGMCGFCILNCILGGQTLSAVSGGSLSWTVGIVIIAIVSLLISFCGFKVLAWYERLAWIPVLIVFLIAAGMSGKQLSDLPPYEPATAPLVLSFASTIAGFVITYSPLSSDFTVYFTPEGSSFKLFLWSYLGLLIPIILCQCFGAAAALAAMNIPAWEDAYAANNVGGLLLAMIGLGGFGEFLTVLLSLCVTANISMTIYSFCLNAQILVPCEFVTRLPRYLFSIVGMAIIIPLSIVGSHRFTDALTNFLGLIGYWASAFIGVLLTEHFLFRRADPAAYDIRYWNTPSRLPLGVAALAASIASFGLVVPCMDQVWFVGPIAEKTGDIGFEMAGPVTAVLYVPFRWMELRWWGS